MNATTEPQPRGTVFLFFFTNRAFLCAVATSWAVFWVWFSWRTNDWNWFARSGAVLGILGGVLSCRSVLRLTRQERIRRRHMTIAECFSPSELEDQERDSSATVLGAILLILGTLVWDYGDLLSRLL